MTQVQELDNPKANQDIFPGLCPPDPFDVGQISKLDVYLCVEYIYIYILSKLFRYVQTGQNNILG